MIAATRQFRGDGYQFVRSILDCRRITRDYSCGIEGRSCAVHCDVASCLRRGEEPWESSKPAGSGTRAISAVSEARRIRSFLVADSTLATRARLDPALSFAAATIVVHAVSRDLARTATATSAAATVSGS